MKSFGSLLLVAALWLKLCRAQDDTAVYTDQSSGIVFNIWPTGDLTFGMALPSNALTTDATEFIGLLTCSSPKGQGTGWCGISLGGSMVNNLLLVAYPDQGKVLTSFRWATEYRPPVVYTGNAALTQISSTVNSTHYSLIFRCRNCLQWSQGENSGAAATSDGYLVLGWCHAQSSPNNGACPSSLSVRQHETQNILAVRFNSAVANRSYTSWVSKATATVTGRCGGGSSTATITGTPRTTTSTAPTPPPGCSERYTVTAGDYCYLVATQHGITLDQLYKYNPGLNCDNLQIGRVLCVHGG